MADFTKIKNKKLCEELKKSRRFKLMSDNERQETINQIAKLPTEEQRDFIKFMLEENDYEEKKYKKNKEEQLSLLESFIQEITELTTKFEKLANEDKEKQSKKAELSREKKLLEKLKNL